MTSLGKGAAEAQLAMIKRFCIGVLAAGGALATIIALKAALFWVFHYD